MPLVCVALAAVGVALGEGHPVVQQLALAQRFALGERLALQERLALGEQLAPAGLVALAERLVEQFALGEGHPVGSSDLRGLRCRSGLRWENNLHLRG